jgi:hypothetical protein
MNLTLEQALSVFSHRTEATGADTANGSLHVAARREDTRSFTGGKFATMATARVRP